MFSKQQIQEMVDNNLQGWEYNHFWNDNGLEALIDLLDLNKDRLVRINAPAVEIDRKKLNYQNNNSDIVICGIKIKKEDIWDIRCGNYYGGSFIIYAYEGTYALSMLEREYNENCSYILNDYFLELLKYNHPEYVDEHLKVLNLDNNK